MAGEVGRGLTLSFYRNTELLDCVEPGIACPVAGQGIAAAVEAAA